MVFVQDIFGGHLFRLVDGGLSLQSFDRIPSFKSSASEILAPVG